MGNKPHRIPCYASVHVCDTFCYAYDYVNTNFEAFVYELLIGHTPITKILIEHTLIIRIYSISVLEKNSSFPSYAALQICGFFKDCQYIFSQDS